MTFSLSPSSVSRLAVDGSLGEHSRRLLERCCRDERTRLQARLGDAEQNRMSRLRRFLPSIPHLSVDLVELDPVDLLALQQLGVAGVIDLDLLQHLANDHLDVLVVDVHALQPIDLLDLVDEVGRQFLDALDGRGCRAAAGLPSTMQSPFSITSPS